MNRRRILLSAGALSAAAHPAVATLAYAQAPQSPTFRSERISIVTRGAGPDIILVPGLTSHRDVWAGVAASLEGRFRLHLVQVNGFAGFPAGANADGPVSAPAAEEIARYASEARLVRPAVIGHSMGGTIGLMMAARRPDSVGRLMVVDMFPYLGVMFGPPGATAESVKATADGIREQMKRAAPGSASMMEQRINSMVRTESARPALLQQARSSDRNVMADAFHELVITDLRPELARITAPVTVLYVTPPDAPMTPEQIDGFYRTSYAGLANVRLVRVPDSYHFIQIDQPDRFLAEVATFMAN